MIEFVNIQNLVEAYSRIVKVSYYQIFAMVVFLDLLTGWGKAFITHTADSRVGSRGLLRHLMVVSLVFLVCPYLWLLGMASFARAILAFFILTYLSLIHI